MKLALLSTLFATSAAFMAPAAPRASTSLAVNELEIGVTDPLGVFDPLGWLETQPESFERRRAVERKHGRISMVAIIGMLVHNAGIELPGSLTLDGSVKVRLFAALISPTLLLTHQHHFLRVLA